MSLSTYLPVYLFLYLDSLPLKMLNEHNHYYSIVFQKTLKIPTVGLFYLKRDPIKHPAEMGTFFCAIKDTFGTYNLIIKFQSAVEQCGHGFNF